MPNLFSPTPTGYVVATGRVAQTYDEALRRAQELQKQLGVQLYVSPLSTGGYRLQTGRISSQSEANRLAQQWARYGVQYVSPLYTPANQAQRYQQVLERAMNEAFSRATNSTTYRIDDPGGFVPSPSSTTNVYGQQAQQIIGNLLNNLLQPFRYDPTTDPVFRTASEATQRAVMEAMNERGILTSTVTADRMAQAVGELAGQFADMAYRRYLEQQQSLLNLLGPILNQAQFEAQLPLQVAELIGSYGGTPTLAARAQQLEREQMQMQALSNIINTLVNQAQFERSFPLAEAELTGRLYGQPTLPAQQNQIAAIIDLLRLLPFIPRGIGQYVPGPLGQILSQLQNTRLTLGNLLQ